MDLGYLLMAVCVDIRSVIMNICLHLGLDMVSGWVLIDVSLKLIVFGVMD